ncbi:MAG: pyrimidine-nucleoside phosphorylase [Lachnospiraceae bacterium]|nr:pyrimidine-nucleoside phosphorylase [Lachnospiraceae bacterium]
MRMYELIEKKRNGGALTDKEIAFMIEGYTKGNLPDYQMSAMLMAIYFKGMTEEETACLTKCMAQSGELLDLSEIKDIKVDKHSTGGVGDKTSIALVPLMAACGLNVAKMSGRGLGFTGGTIDKLESIPSFTTDIDNRTFINNVKTIGAAIMSQTEDLCPADKKLYALRDVTATIESMPLIASSIMSKKIAAGADAIVLEVMSGSGAFMKNDEDARELSEIMVRIGRLAGRKCVAVITEMNEPLGCAVGNSLELIEAIETLKGRGNAELMTVLRTLGSQMLLLGEKVESEAEGEVLIDEVIANGKAVEKLRELVGAQGGDPHAVEDYTLLPKASIVEQIESPVEGYIESVRCDEIGMCVHTLGGGRSVKDEPVDLSVGLMINKKVGDFVHKGESLAEIHGNSAEKIQEAKDRFLKAYSFSQAKVEHLKLIHGIIR